MLSQLGFHQKWINWVMNCITTSTFSVLVNNSPGSCFGPSRGIRQGDPLAPYIFVLAMEYLARTLHRECDCNNSKIGIKLTPGGTPIPFLSFADDTIIFAKANNESIDKIKLILEDFSQVSGLKINL